MEKTKFDEYLKDRYKKEIDWYDKRSASHKLYFVLFQWTVIILSALIPVLTVSVGRDYTFVTAGLGVLLAICTAGLKAFKFQENWVNYRTIAETLKKEKHYYDAGLSDYGKADDKEALFIDRVESLISRENSLWITVQRKQEAEDETRKR